MDAAMASAARSGHRNIAALGPSPMSARAVRGGGRANAIVHESRCPRFVGLSPVAATDLVCLE
jgi:hypothetical protein